jgi:O-antigen/teichoic acid export membrane protein
MNFFKAFYLTGVTSVLVTIIAFFNNIIITRYLGTAGRGKYSIILNSVVILALVFGEGIRRSNIIRVVYFRKKIFQLVKKNLTYFFSLTFGLLVIYFGFSNLSSKILRINEKYILLIILATVLNILWRLFQAIFLGLEDYKNYNFVQFIYTSLIFIVNIFIVFIFHFSLFEIIINIIFISVIIVFLEIIKLSKIKVNNVEIKSPPESNNLILRATIASILGFILLKGDIFLVNYYLKDSITGIYSITLVITDLFQRLPLVLGPIVIARSASRNLDEELLKIAKMSRVLVAINILAVVFMIFFGRWLIVFLFSDKFVQSFDLLIYILPALIVFASGHIINAFFMGRGFPNFLILNNFVFAGLDLLLNILFIPKFGVKTAAISCSVSYTLWALSFIFYFILKYKIGFKDMFIVKKEDIILIKNSIM